MKREMLKAELEKELANKQDVWLRLKEQELLFGMFESSLELTKSVDEDIILRLTEMYQEMREQGDSTPPTPMLRRAGKESQQLIMAILLLGLWDDMEELVALDSLRTKLRFLDYEKFPEVYFAYMVVIKGETDPEVFGCSTNPMDLLSDEFQEAEPGDNLRKILKETVKEMIKEKFKRQHVYRLLD